MTATIDLVFDGQCGFCTRAVYALQRLDRHHRLRFHPFQRAGVRERFGLSFEEAHQAVWSFGPGPRQAGAAAVNASLDAALGVRMFSAVYRVPGLRQVQDHGYRWIADHRYRLRGVTPWCVSHPEDCGLAVAGAGCGWGASHSRRSEEAGFDQCSVSAPECRKSGEC